MFTNDNRYRTPRSEDASRAPFRRALVVFLGWLAAASLLGGVSLAWRTAHALVAFAAEAHAAGLVAVSVLRALAGQAAASAAGVALVACTHHRSAAGAELRPAWPPWRIYALVPFAWPVAATLMIGAGELVLLAYGVDAATSQRSFREIVIPADLILGAASASLDTLVLGAAATAAVPRLAGVRASLGVKVVVALVATGLVVGTVQGVLAACLPADGRTELWGPWFPAL